MSTTRSQKRKNNQQRISESVSEGFVSPIEVGNSCPPDQDVDVAGPSKPKSPTIENSLLESLRTSLKEEITSEIKNLLVESQKEMLKPHTPMKSVGNKSTQNDDANISRNMVTGVLTDSTNQPKRTKVRSQSQPT